MTDRQRKAVDAIDNGFSASAVGGLLRQARERSGQSLASTAQQLRIRESYLQAIEQGDFRRLPGATYAVGFVRSYADHLGLDPQEIVRRFREEVDDLGRRTALSFPSVSAEAKIPGGVILLIAAFVALVGYGGWYYLSDRDDSIAALVPEVPLAMQQPAGEVPPAAAETLAPAGDAALQPIAPDMASGMAPVADDGAAALGTGETDVTPPSPEGSEQTQAEDLVPPEADAAPESDAPAVSDTDLSSDAAAALAEVAAATGPAAMPVAPAGSADTESIPADETVRAPGAGATLPPAPALPDDAEPLPVGREYGTTNADARIVLVAVQESWVQVKTATGEEVWTKVLRTGDRYLVPNEAGLLLATGNAGGLQILVDGRPTPRLGPVGVVKREISLDPDRLLAGSTAP
jgi:cytoskeleton protein RodZ